MDELMASIAVATAECGMQILANWCPVARHDELRELLHDLTVGALVAYCEAKCARAIPEPSPN